MGTRAGVRRPLAGFGLAGVLLLLLLVAVTGAPARADPSPTPGSVTVKYYVVEAPRNGQREYLFEIARRFLGDGGRYLEIFQLNQGREQPDGQRLTDPAVLNPGWILILPGNATGPGVREGPLPALSAPAVPGPAPDDAGAGVSTTVVVMAGALLLATTLAGLGWRRRRRGPTSPRLRRAPPPDHPTVEPPATDDSLVPPPPRRRALQLTSFAFDAQVRHGNDVLAVRLTGARTRVRPPYQWVAAGASRPRGQGVVALGVRGDMLLFVDLSMCPDVLTVSGPAAPRARLVHALAGQLDQAGVQVTVVGGVAGETAPPGAVDVLTYASIGAAGRSPAVVFGPPANRDTLPAPRRDGVLVVVGSPVRARWSMHLHGSDREEREERAPASPGVKHT